MKFEWGFPDLFLLEPHASDCNRQKQRLTESKITMWLYVLLLLKLATPGLERGRSVEERVISADLFLVDLEGQAVLCHSPFGIELVTIYETIRKMIDMTLLPNAYLHQKYTVSVLREKNSADKVEHRLKKQLECGSSSSITRKIFFHRPLHSTSEQKTLYRTYCLDETRTAIESFCSS
jgi:hypothetical protein